MNNNNKKPLILVLEDADMALVSRKSSRGNPAALAEILNLGDGLIGEMLDLRIIATTNAERIELDPAITRPGRMCTHLTLGELPTPQLAGIYNRLTEGESGPAMVKKSQATTLAEVYRLARDAAWAAKDTESEDHGTYL
jgi:ATP-dependent 26S proteasome regulatory subunit